MSFLKVQAFLSLILFDLYIDRGDFAALYGKVRNYPLGTAAPMTTLSIRSALLWTWHVSGTGRRYFACNVPLPRPVCSRSMACRPSW